MASTALTSSTASLNTVTPNTGTPEDAALDAPPIAITDPTTPHPDIIELRTEIDELDAEILRLIKRRTEVSRQIGTIRKAEGGPRIVLRREQEVLERFRELGSEGRELGMMLLRLGRGRLGRA